MGCAAIAKNVSEPSEDSKSAIEGIALTHTAELIIGLCGPIGSPIHETADAVKKVLENQYGYTCIIIRLSDIIRKDIPSMDKLGAYEQKEALINKGDELRERYGDDLLVKWAILQITGDREQGKRADRYESRRICYIIDSIKNKQELRTLEAVYRDIFYCFGVFSVKEKRVARLNKKIELADVYKLIDRDSGEEIHNGQSVEDTFPLADFFIRVDDINEDALEKKILRALHLIFSDKIITPTAHEFAMYHAAATASNSSCMSRQVGACITDQNGRILSVGWNEVPRPFGGVYSGCPMYEENTHRCFQGEGCTNKKQKDELCDTIINELTKRVKGLEGKAASIKETLERTPINNLLEFSRSIHAEMNAIILGAQKTADKMVNGRLYCTTFPCHNCARHIVVAGIKEVYYIEPYQKSLAMRLHGDALTENPAEEGKVKLLLFDGVAPARYMDFFTKRRDLKEADGGKKKYSPREVFPQATLSLESIPALEAIIVRNMKKAGLIEADDEKK